MSSETTTLDLVMYGLEVFGILVVLAAIVDLIIIPLYKKHVGYRYRVKTVIIYGRVSHYYPEFKPGYDYNWGTIYMYESGNFRVTSDESEAVQCATYDQAVDICRKYKEYRTPIKINKSKAIYNEVCED